MMEMYRIRDVSTADTARGYVLSVAPAARADTLEKSDTPSHIAGNHQSAIEQFSADPSNLAALQTATANGWKIPERAVGNLGAAIGALHLSARPSHVLKRLGVPTVRELLQRKPAEIVLSKNCGKKSISEIERKVFEYLSGRRLGAPELWPR
jgi:DNA-directed RNA polymerase alpha subunit